jgi:hypothetical protein
MPYEYKRPNDSEELVIFRPDSRNSSLDYMIPRKVAEKLFQDNEIYGDATNGGYMPNPDSKYSVIQHKVRWKYLER